MTSERCKVDINVLAQPKARNSLETGWDNMGGAKNGKVMMYTALVRSLT